MALLEARGRVKIFGKLMALNGAELTVAENEFHGLIGPNGSGKSTLMKCVAGAEIPTAGTVTFGGRDITQASPAERARAGMSLKFQITSVLPALTLYDNILLALQAQTSLPSLVFSRTRGVLHDRAMAMLEQCRLVDRAADPASALSHGQQQWLEIAMALAPEPRLLLLDEPTGGMSLEERRVTGELLQPIKKRCSLVIVEHDLDFIRDICDRLTLLDQGSVLDCGSVQHIQSSANVQEGYLRRACRRIPRYPRSRRRLCPQPGSVRRQSECAVARRRRHPWRQRRRQDHLDEGHRRRIAAAWRVREPRCPQCRTAADRAAHSSRTGIRPAGTLGVRPAFGARQSCCRRADEPGQPGGQSCAGNLSETGPANGSGGGHA